MTKGLVNGETRGGGWPGERVRHGAEQYSSMAAWSGAPIEEEDASDLKLGEGLFISKP